jgi:hypothetical protein
VMENSNPMASHAWSLLFGEQPNDIGRQLDFCCYFKKNMFKASNTSLNSAENTMTKKEYKILWQRKSILVALSINLAWTKQQWCTLSNHHQISCGVLSSWGAKTLWLFPLCPSLLCGSKQRGYLRYSELKMLNLKLCGGHGKGP